MHACALHWAVSAWWLNNLDIVAYIICINRELFCLCCKPTTEPNTARNETYLYVKWARISVPHIVWVHCCKSATPMKMPKPQNGRTLNLTITPNPNAHHNGIPNIMMRPATACMKFHCSSSVSPKCGGNNQHDERVFAYHILQMIYCSMPNIKILMHCFI